MLLWELIWVCGEAVAFHVSEFCRDDSYSIEPLGEAGENVSSVGFVGIDMGVSEALVRHDSEQLYDCNR